ncbi:MAG: putative metal-binding motif-containing protein, partial [Deltaproteobacteria bacterium]|nr:putative metal-binding motif-containing protein [Deltaproteobacteria bacterium]
ADAGTPDAAPDARPGPDARVEEDASTTCRGPADCDDGTFCNGRERCAPGEDGADAMGCVAGPTCLDGQTCNEDTDRCESDCGSVLDADGDGAIAIDCGGNDCDDSRSDVNPRAAETCDGVDQDCDDTTDDGATCPRLEICEAGACVGSDDWAVPFRGDVVTVAFDPAGRVVVGGRANEPETLPPGAGTNQGFVAVYETDGTPAWARTLGMGYAEVGSVSVDAMGRVVAAGRYQVNLASGHPGPDPRITSTDVFVATWESDGTPVWAARFLGVEEWEIPGAIILPGATAALDDAGRVYAYVSSDGLSFAGETLVPAAYEDMMLLAFERDGTPRWAARVGGAYRERGGLVHVDADTLFLAGPVDAPIDFDGHGTVAPVGMASSYVASFGTDGSFGWAIPIGSEGASVYVQAVATDATGNPCIGGTYSLGTLSIGRFALPWTPPMPGVSGGGDAFVACLDRADGAVIWARGWGNAWHDRISGLALDADGELVIAGDFLESLALDAFSGTALPDADGDYCQLGYFAWLDASSGLLRRAVQMSELSCTQPAALAVDPSGTLASVGYLGGLLEIGSARIEHARFSRNFVLRFAP